MLPEQRKNRTVCGRTMFAPAVMRVQRKRRPSIQRENSHPPNPDFHMRTPPARRTRTDTPAIPFSRRVKPPVREVPERHAAVERGMGSRLNSPSRALAPASRYAPSGFANAVSAKAGRRSGEADGGARKRRRRQAAPQDSAAGGQAQGVHRAAGQPNDEKVSALMYSRRQQEQRQHAAPSAHQSAAMSTRKPSRT